MRFVMQEVVPATIKRHYEAMPDEVRRGNNLINNEKALDSPLLPSAVQRFKRVFTDIERRPEESPWLAGGMFSLADNDHLTADTTCLCASLLLCYF
jgi:glutathione S-transferase